MAPKKSVSRAAEGNSSNGGEINSQMMISSGSKRKVRENGFSSSVNFNVDEELKGVDLLIKKLEFIRGEKNHFLAFLAEKFEDLEFYESECEDEKEEEDLEIEQAGFDGLKIKEKGSSSLSSMDKLHLKVDQLIKLFESEHKKHKCFSTFSSSSIPHTEEGFYSKLDRVSELFDLEKKKQRRVFNVISTYMKSKFGFDYPGYPGCESESEEDVEEEECCESE
ncbi:hypothetical protein BVC80_9069g30 [Macleaya cordata]|uniref:Uncharacterized protein n=1 Tax=Macleaya cordata TaxID=56857 RepID=A0A200PNZ2_MACCD|nr:hypothetical protein BVC80_9069g30 [Macleaya cordata]